MVGVFLRNFLHLRDDYKYTIFNRDCYDFFLSKCTNYPLSSFIARRKKKLCNSRHFVQERRGNEYHMACLLWEVIHYFIIQRIALGNKTRICIMGSWSQEYSGKFFPPGINQIQHTLCLGNFKSLNFVGCGGQCPPEEAVKVRANGPWEDYVQRGGRDVSNREERTRLCQSPPWTWIGHTTGQGQEGRTGSFLPRMSGWLGSGWDAVVGPSRTNVLQTNSSTSVS